MDQRRSVFTGWGVLVGIPALFVAAFIIPKVPWLSSIGLCTVRRFLGFDCPGCGLKSSFIELVHGHFNASIDFHPLGIVIAAWLVYVFMRQMYSLLKGRPWPPILKQAHRDAILWVFIAVLLLQWIVKLAV